MRCEVCDERYEIERIDFDYTGLAGLDGDAHRVILEHVEVLRCGCGDAPRLPNIEGLHHAIGLLLIREGSPLDGSAVRFLRKTMGLTQREFASAIEIDAQSLSDWEREKRIPKKPTRVSAAVQFLGHVLHREDLARNLSMELIADTLDRLAARGQGDFSRRETALSVDCKGRPPAWMISELRGDEARGPAVGGLE